MAILYSTASPKPKFGGRHKSNFFSIDDMCDLFSCFMKQKFLFLFLLFNSFHKVISLEKYFLLGSILLDKYTNGSFNNEKLKNPYLFITLL